MSRLFACFIATLLLSGCALTTTATLAPNRYAVTAHGNFYHSPEDLHAAIERKVAKICKGAGYTFEGQGQGGTTWVTSYYNGTPIVAPATQLTETASCVLAQP